jgi:hypothetical protein
MMFSCEVCIAMVFTIGFCDESDEMAPITLWHERARR